MNNGGENLTSNTGENLNNQVRETGRMTLEAEKAQRTKELLEQRARLEEEQKALEERIAKNKRILGVEIPEEGIVEKSSTTGTVEEPAETSTEDNTEEPKEVSTEEIEAIAKEVKETGTSPENLREEIEKEAKKRLGLKSVIAGAAIAALAFVIGFGVANTGERGNNNEQDNKAKTESEANDNSTPFDEVINKASIRAEDLEKNEAEQGIKDGYGEKGMWLDNRIDKPNSVNFANGETVLGIFDGDMEEAIKYTAENEVEAFGAYLGCIPQEVKDYYGVGQTFQKNMTILEADEALERAPDSLYDQTKKEFFDLMDKASEEREITLNGWYDNAYMDLGDKNGSVDHKNMELVKCTTFETGTKATEFVWKDDNGNILGSLIVKEACCQPVREKTDGPSPFDGMREIPNDPEHPDRPAPVKPENPDEPDKPDEPTPEPKKQTEADENSGAKDGIVSPEGQDRPVTAIPILDEDHLYVPETNTYYYPADEQADKIGYEETNGTNSGIQESVSTTSAEEVTKAEEAVSSQTAPAMVTGTQQGATGEAGVANNFDAGATTGTGEVTGDTQSSDGSGDTIKENLEKATGNEQTNPGGDYTQGF